MKIPVDTQGLNPARRGSDRPLIGLLLAHAATGEPLNAAAGRQFGWQAMGNDERQFQWALRGGLGPLLHHAIRDDDSHLPAPWREALLSADLTARVRHADWVDTLLQVVDACERLQIEATLLKGISVSEQFYPEEHFRPMADVDVLIPEQALSRVESVLLDEGFIRVEFPPIDGLHHGAPLRHAQRDTIVELHRSLFPNDSALCSGTVFNPAQVARRSVASTYHGRPVARLSPELQLVYIAASWFNDLTHHKVQPGFLATLFDAVYLLAAAGGTLDWSRLLQSLDNEMARASLYAMMSYLPRHGVQALPPAILARLDTTRRLVGPIQLKWIHEMLDRYLIGGRPWDFVLPPPVPGRYSPGHQFEKRVLGRLRRQPA